MWVYREDTKVLKRNPPEKGEETGIAMDNMKPSGSCPEKIEVVVVVVVVSLGPIGFVREQIFGITVDFRQVSLKEPVELSLVC